MKSGKERKEDTLALDLRAEDLKSTNITTEPRLRGLTLRGRTFKSE
jgi:hypothetical protein